MKYVVEDIIDGPLEDVIKICLDRSRDVDVYPNITKVTIKKSEDRDNKRFLTIETVANGDIPPALRKLINPKMLTWTEEAVHDFKTNDYKYKVRTHFFTNVCSISGHFTYREKDGKTVRTLNGEVKINIPILGQVAEKKIVEVQKDNLKLDVTAVRKELAKK